MQIPVFKSSRIYRQAAACSMFGVVGVTVGTNVASIVPLSARGFITGESMTLLLLGIGLFLAGRILRRPTLPAQQKPLAHARRTERLSGVRTNRVALAE